MNRYALRLTLCLAALLAAFPPTAAASDSKAAMKGYMGVATKVMNMDALTFIAFKRSHRHEYPLFDWSSNGCNVPALSPGLFRPACEQHDFGYGNFGGRLKLTPTEDMREWIDGRQKVEMYRICNRAYAGFLATRFRQRCYVHAEVNWGGVHVGGATAFAG